MARPILIKESSVRASDDAKKAAVVTTEPRLPPAPTMPETTPSADRLT